ncbi:MAG: hypothetical protein ACYCT9_12455 [Leptospirillum sp.]
MSFHQQIPHPQTIRRNTTVATKREKGIHDPVHKPPLHPANTSLASGTSWGASIGAVPVAWQI